MIKIDEITWEKHNQTMAYLFEKKGYAKCLADVEKRINKTEENSQYNKFERLKRSIQALKNHSQEGTKPCKGKEVSNPPQQHLVNSSDSSECASDSPSGDLCRKGCGEYICTCTQGEILCGIKCPKCGLVHYCELCKQFTPKEKK